jgi:preprotein translocase subunit SecG
VFFEVLILSTLNVVLFITGTTLPVTQKGEDAGFLDGSNINRQVFGAMTFAVAIINFIAWFAQVFVLIYAYQVLGPIERLGKKIATGVVDGVSKVFPDNGGKDNYTQVGN